jgi:phosphoribosylamine--glycine ligase
VLPLLETPLADVLRAAATGSLGASPPLRWRSGAAVTVVIASAGYPSSSRSGDVISGVSGAGFIHAGTARAEGGELVTAGGRVLSVTATGVDLSAARDAAYALVDRVSLADAVIRRDIALAAVEGRIRVPG